MKTHPGNPVASVPDRTPSILAACALDASTVALLLCSPEPRGDVRVLGDDSGVAPRWAVLDLTGDGDASARFNRVLMLHRGAMRPGAPRPWVCVASGDRESTFSEGDVEARTLPLDAFLREHLAGLHREWRLEILRFLTRSVLLSPEVSPVLHQSLFRVRGLLREMLPIAGADPDHPALITVEGLYRIDDTLLCLQGWMRAGAVAPRRLTVVSPEGDRVEILGHTHEVGCPDPREGGGFQSSFLSLVELEVPSRIPDGWVVEFEDSQGAAQEVPVASSVQDLGAIREELLLVVEKVGVSRECLVLDRVLRPALERIQGLLAARVDVAEVVDFGTSSSSPEVSIVIPIYQRTDFMEHQFAQFAGDPSLARAEILFVLDSPEIRRYFLDHCRLLQELYRIPFRVVTLTENGGFSVANNLAVRVARGRLVLLLNSDVFPDRRGWLDTWVAFHDGRPGIGASGVKLLYAEDSIQHAGMDYFEQAPGEAWNIEHCFKGYPRRFAAAEVSRQVPAVTGAALMVDKALYQQVGGLSGDYVRGDFEDSDLCLRLRKAGREVWYCAEVEMYHLEGQSYPSAIRELASRYNRWLHWRRWGDVMGSSPS